MKTRSYGTPEIDFLFEREAADRGLNYLDLDTSYRNLYQESSQNAENLPKYQELMEQNSFSAMDKEEQTLSKNEEDCGSEEAEVRPSEEQNVQHSGRRRFFSDPESCSEFPDMTNSEYYEDEFVTEYSETDLDSIGSPGTIHLNEQLRIGGSDSRLQLNHLRRSSGNYDKRNSFLKRHGASLQRRVSTIAALGRKFSFQLLKAKDNVRRKSEIKEPNPLFESCAIRDLPIIQEGGVLNEKDRLNKYREPVAERPMTETEELFNARAKSPKLIKERLSPKSDCTSELKRRDNYRLMSTPLERKLGYAGVAPFFGNAIADKLSLGMRSKSFSVRSSEKGLYPYSESRAKSFTKEFQLERPDNYIENFIDDSDSYYAYKQKQNRTKSFRFTNAEIPPNVQNKVRSRSMIIKSRNLLDEPYPWHPNRNNTTNDNIRRKNPHIMIA